MKTIGLIGGMSWESTAEYYRYLNEGVKERLGGFHSAKILLSSVDFDDYEKLQRESRWQEAGFLLAQEAQNLEKAGAACLLLCTNTMHKVAGSIQFSVNIPLLHIADPTGAAIQTAGLKRIGLLGTRFTMEEDFYKKRLNEVFDLDVVVPDEKARLLIHDVIYNELCMGLIEQNSRQAFIEIIRDLECKGCQGIILGCTEIGMLVQSADSPLPLFDTTRLHARAALDFSLA